MVTDQEAGSAPLAGIRVLELGNFIAAPFAGMVFADFGADVIKIERPGSGDELRGGAHCGAAPRCCFGPSPATNAPSP